jgi:hypothetical protein
LGRRDREELGLNAAVKVRDIVEDILVALVDDRGKQR